MATIIEPGDDARAAERIVALIEKYSIPGVRDKVEAGDSRGELRVRMVDCAQADSSHL